MNAKDLVRNEVLHCQTLLVNEQFQNGNFGEEHYPDTEEEIIEWWLVTWWLAERLREQGEVVIQEYDCYWWGRTCGGQALFHDHVIKTICEE